MHCLRHCLLDTKKLRRKKNLLESFNCREFASAEIPFFVKLFFMSIILVKEVILHRCSIENVKESLMRLSN